MFRHAVRNDLSIYNTQASGWWDPASLAFRSLQSITVFRLEQLLSWVGDIEGKVVVDIGCGGGLMSVPLAQRGAQVTGFDLSEPSLAEARRHAPAGAVFIAADARSIPFPDNSADIVILADILDHIADYDVVFAEVARILRPDGYLYVNTINRTWQSWLLAYQIGEMVRLIPPGTHDFSLFIKPSELLEVAEQNHFTVCAWQGEAPSILRTAMKWAIVFRKTASLAVAYSALFKRRER
ncbi:MAG: bifunctional 2-polyprenyl-6-hydroxyphenol methylase/3-demethylubiquinol 3-O-methyltransferase UbiG [bacterium]|nr:bifunctional 2-polyprenyl-6-hydroxyphenol methylase/3-demethylubiquinol 3-O-methyltransferase UbiG [bacterium]